MGLSRFTTDDDHVKPGLASLARAREMRDPGLERVPDRYRLEMDADTAVVIDVRLAAWCGRVKVARHTCRRLYGVFGRDNRVDIERTTRDNRPQQNGEAELRGSTGVVSLGGTR